MTQRIVLIGAGSAMFTRGLVADLLRRARPCDLALVDTDPDALRVAERLTAKMIEARRAPITLHASTDRREVLGGAAAVICTISVGGRRAWLADVTIARARGIYQPVGDTVMPGGTSRALRMIPPMVAVAGDVLDLAPAALFFNYGNPMGAVCRGIRKATRAPVVGLCHGVFDVAGYLARALGVERAALEYTAVGMNHLTWFTRIAVGGQDALPRLRQVAAARRRPEAGDNPFSWHLFERFGAFPAVLDRHVSEFFPQCFPGGAYYGKTLGVDAFSIEDCIAGGNRIWAEMREQALSPGPLGDDYFARIGGEHEQVVDIIDSVLGDAGRVYSANLPNTGQVPNLPTGAVIECPVVANATGLHAIPQAPLAAGLVGTLAAKFAWVETVVEAALEGSRDKFVQALVIDGAVGSLDAAERLADDLLAAQAAHLPQFARAAARGGAESA